MRGLSVGDLLGDLLGDLDRGDLDSGDWPLDLGRTSLAFVRGTGGGGIGIMLLLLLE